MCGTKKSEWLVVLTIFSLFGSGSAWACTRGSTLGWEPISVSAFAGASEEGPGSTELGVECTFGNQAKHGLAIEFGSVVMRSEDQPGTPLLAALRVGEAAADLPGPQHLHQGYYTLGYRFRLLHASRREGAKLNLKIYLGPGLAYYDHGNALGYNVVLGSEVGLNKEASYGLEFKATYHKPDSSAAFFNYLVGFRFHVPDWDKLTDRAAEKALAKLKRNKIEG